MRESIKEKRDIWIAHAKIYVVFAPKGNATTYTFFQLSLRRLLEEPTCELTKPHNAAHGILTMEKALARWRRRPLETNRCVDLNKQKRKYQSES